MLKQSRTQQVVKNALTNSTFIVLKGVLQFVNRWFFIHMLGKEYLGLNSLLINILYLFSLAELGINFAIGYSLYKPLAKNDYRKISSIIYYLKQAYQRIGLVIVVLGVAFLPFLGLVVGENIPGMYLAYILYLANTALLYFVSYKDVLIISDQKNYKLFKYNLLFLIAINILQIAVLIVSRDFVIYLLVWVILAFLQRYTINRFITKTYPEVDFNSPERLGADEVADIRKYMNAAALHKIGDVAVNGTDSIIISIFISIAVVGIYSNYLMVVLFVNSVISAAFLNVTSSFGNLIQTAGQKHRLAVFRKIDFINYFLYGASAAALAGALSKFIAFWAGESYVLEPSIVIVVLLNFYITGRRIAISTVKDAGGIFTKDKYSSVAQALINLVVSVILATKLGLLGVVLGTLISGLVLPTWLRPFLVYKYIFKVSSSRYWLEYLKQLAIILISVALAWYLIGIWLPDSSLLAVILSAIISMVVFVIISSLVYWQSEEQKYLLGLLKGVFRRVKTQSLNR